VITQNTTVADDGVALLIGQYKNKPRLEALLRSYLAPFQELENVIWDVLTGRLIDNAVGKQLDVLGKIAGQPRLGYDDSTYRLYISAKALVNRSRGRCGDILGIVTLLLGSFTYSFLDLYPGSFVIETDGPVDAGTVSRAKAIADLIARARTAGVGSSFHYTDEAFAGTFEFSATDNMNDIDAPHGWADDAGTTGGTFLGAF
jgi:hypothetical protein